MMLKVDAFRLHASNKHEVSRYAQGVNMLQSWYTYKEKPTHLLTPWNRRRFSVALPKCLDMSEVDFVNGFKDNMMSLRQQLHHTYHRDRQLRDRLLT